MENDVVSLQDGFPAPPYTIRVSWQELRMQIQPQEKSKLALNLCSRIYTKIITIAQIFAGCQVSVRLTNYDRLWHRR